MKLLTDTYWKKFKKTDSKFNIKNDGLKFELLIDNLLEIMYGQRWNRTKKTHDNNRDFWIMLNDDRIWAECKNYQNTIALDVLAPTLVMAQVYEANIILFFSRSRINEKAKDKILAYGEKTFKKIVFYDAERLENLILENAKYLPRKYRPRQTMSSQGSTLDWVSMYFFQDALIGAIASIDEFIPYTSAENIHYNEIFTLLIIVKNPYPNKTVNITISFAEQNPYRFYFQYMNEEITSDKYICYTYTLNPGDGRAISINLRPVVFKSNITLPIFCIELEGENEKNVHWESQAVNLKCAWIGQSKLIGFQYEKILYEVENTLVDNARFSCLLFTGSSGTGKTRMLMECTSIFLKYGYKILNLAVAENFLSSYLLKEIIYFIYEIPKSLILSVLEEKLDTDNDDNDIEQNTTKVRKALKMIRCINNTSTEQELFDFIDKYGDILYEKISGNKYVITIDNLQFSGDAFHYFIKQYIKYSVNQCRPNYSILIGVFNQDYITASASELLFDLLHLNIANILSYDLKGFFEPEQGILFLRELIRTKEDQYDSFFRELIDIISLKPYNLYQMVQLMEEEGLIQVQPNNQGYVFMNDLTWNAALSLPHNFKEVLLKRYKFISSIIGEELFERILSVLYLFDKIDNDLMSLFSLEGNHLDFLCTKHFLRKNRENLYEFDHDIIRRYYIQDHEEGSALACLLWIKEHKCQKLLEEYLVPNCIYHFSILEDSAFTLNICKHLHTLQIPKRLGTIFYGELFKICLKIGEEFDSYQIWFHTLQGICAKIREQDGSARAEYFYSKVYRKISSRFSNYDSLYSFDFRQMLHSYCDILIQSHKREEAELLIKEVLAKSEKEPLLDYEAADERRVLRAIMYNRWYVSYNNAEPTEEIKNKRKNYMKKSRDNINYIKDVHKRLLIKYLNDSDEGYNYYGYLNMKPELFRIWKDCIGNIPETVPEKTMNYYRKLIQYDLISCNYYNTILHIKQGREYLESGQYSHEPLIFNTFFIMAEIMNNLQHFPQKKHIYISRLIEDSIKIQRILRNGKMGDILLLKGIDAYYTGNKNDTYYSFKKAYEEYAKGQTSRYWIKRNLLLENIHIAFSELDIYSDGYDFEFLPKEYKTPLSKEQLSVYQVSGIQRTPDGKMNLALI
ncbi:MAG: restriction endonuclease [Clostridia bacterium]|nr:restriction endonuclease [Clostridia bacterium]